MRRAVGDGRGRPGVRVARVEVEQRRPGRHDVPGPGVHQHGRGGGVLQDEPDPLRRIPGVERQVRGSRPEHGEQRGDEIGAAPQTDADPVPGTDARGQQPGPDLLDPRVERAVGERRPVGVRPRQQGERVRPFAHGAGEGHEHVLGVRGQRSAVAGERRQRLLGGSERQQLGERQRRVGRTAPQDAFQGLGVGPHGVRVEQVGAELADAGGDISRAGEFEAEVGAAQPVVQVDEFDGHVGQRDRGRGHVPVTELHLVERRVAQVAVRAEIADQTLEGHLGVGEGAQRGLPRPTDELTERGVPGQVGAHHQRVDEHADHAAQFRTVPTGRGHADDHVLLPGVPHQHRLPGGQRHHERRRPGLSGGLLDALRQLPVQGEVHPTAAVRGGGGAKTVGGQGEQRRGVGEPLAPVVERPRQRLVGELDALPRGPVAVLDGQRLGPALRAAGAGRPAVTERAVARAQLLHQDGARPGVAHDVVVDHDQQGAVRGGADQQGPEEPLALQVEGPAGLPLGRLPLGGVDPAGHTGIEVHHREHRLRTRTRDRSRVQDPLHRLLARGVDDGAQRLVSDHQAVQRRVQRRPVQRTGQPQGHVLVEHPEPRSELIEEPQSFLAEGEGRGHVRGPPRCHRCGDRHALPGGVPAGTCLEPGALFRSEPGQALCASGVCRGAAC